MAAILACSAASSRPRTAGCGVLPLVPLESGEAVGTLDGCAPNAGKLWYASGRNSEIGVRPDQRLLQAANVIDCSQGPLPVRLAQPVFSMGKPAAAGLSGNGAKPRRSKIG